jgi:hypothetical protein
MKKLSDFLNEHNGYKIIDAKNIKFSIPLDRQNVKYLSNKYGLSKNFFEQPVTEGKKIILEAIQFNEENQQ